MTKLAGLLVAVLFLMGGATPEASTKADEDRAAIKKMGAAIRAAFAQGDIAAIMAYHHPDVNKALAWNQYLVGRDAVEADLRATFQQYHLEFEEYELEDLIVEGNMAVEQALFAIRGTPEGGGDSFLFRGRASVVYVRYSESPAGWASLREVIQPATPEE